MNNSLINEARTFEPQLAMNAARLGTGGTGLFYFSTVFTRRKIFVAAPANVGT
jgi:hypothetical protein